MYKKKYDATNYLLFLVNFILLILMAYILLLKMIPTESHSKYNELEVESCIEVITEQVHN